MPRAGQEWSREGYLATFGVRLQPSIPARSRAQTGSRRHPFAAACPSMSGREPSERIGVRTSGRDRAPTRTGRRPAVLRCGRSTPCSARSCRRENRKCPRTADLSNQRYAGLAVFGGEILTRDHWPAYMTEPRQDRINARRATPKRTAHRKGALEAYLLQQLMFCGRCGKRVYAQTTSQHTDETHARRYICSSHLDDRHAAKCKVRPIAADMLEAMLVASLRTLLAAEGDPGDDPADVIDLAGAATPARRSPRRPSRLPSRVHAAA